MDIEYNTDIPYIMKANDLCLAMANLSRFIHFRYKRLILGPFEKDS
jgi:hypothetical protein